MYWWCYIYYIGKYGNDTHSCTSQPDRATGAIPTKGPCPVLLYETAVQVNPVVVPVADNLPP